MQSAGCNYWYQLFLGNSFWVTSSGIFFGTIFALLCVVLLNKELFEQAYL